VRGAGAGGLGGAAGKPGSPGSYDDGEAIAQSECSGMTGKTGVQGRSRPAARVYLNEKLMA